MHSSKTIMLRLNPTGFYFCFIMLFSLFMTTIAFAAEEKKEGAGESVIYTPIPVIVVPLYLKGRVKGFLSVTAQLFISEQKERLYAEKLMPRLKAYYLEDLTRLSNNYFEIDRPIDSGLIGTALQKSTNRALKNKHAKFYVINISVQKRR